MDRADVADNPEPIPMVPLGQDRPTSGSAEGANVVEPTPRIPPAEASQRSTAANRADSAAVVEPTPSVPQGQAGQDSSTVKEPETKYVLSGQPTGWAAMSKEVREFDEEKIQNSKDDVDTLLVFVSIPLRYHYALLTHNESYTGWSILRYPQCLPCCRLPEPPALPDGYHEL